jgi:hypothetical protein
MPKGYPGTGPYAGRRRQAHEPARRAGVLSKAEQNVIDALAADQPSDASETALMRQVDKLARVLRRSPAAVQAQLARAKAKLQARAISYADLHHEAAKNAAARGDGRPSQWALEHLRVVEPIVDKDAGPQMTVVVGMALPGLGLEPRGPITTVLPRDRTTDE